MNWLDFIYYLMLIVLLLAGLFLNILGLPGLWLMVGVHAIYAWVTGFDRYVGWPSIIAVTVLAALAEVAEFVAGAAGSKAAGGSKRGMMGAIVGGLIGGIVGTGVIPIPIVGTIAGACIGSFIGASGTELAIGRSTEDSTRIGWGAFKGRLLGILSKTAFGVAMLIVSMIAAFPRSSRPAPPPLLPATAPATSPATTSTIP